MKKIFSRIVIITIVAIIIGIVIWAIIDAIQFVVENWKAFLYILIMSPFVIYALYIVYKIWKEEYKEPKEHRQWVFDSDYELERLSNIFIQQCKEIYENSFAKYADILFNIKSGKIYEFKRASLIRVQENYIQAILDLSEEYKDFTKKYKDLTGRDIRVPEESKTKYLNNLKKIVDTFESFSDSMRHQTNKLYDKE